MLGPSAGHRGLSNTVPQCAQAPSIGVPCGLIA